MKKQSEKKVCILGSGAWGTVIGSLLADGGREVVIYGRSKGVVGEMNSIHKNTKYLGDGFVINEKVRATLSLEEGVKKAKIIVLAVPSFAIKETAKRLYGIIEKDAVIVNLSKGFDKESGKTLGETLRENLPKECRKNVVSLLGPSFAEEVAKKQYTAITASAKNEKIAREIQEIFSNEYFRVYTNSDTVGTEYCSSLKNVIALASGIADGLGYKANTRAALITRGMAEIVRFVRHFGGREETCFGLAGIGDLILTCSSKTSRNYTAGYVIGSTGIENFKRVNDKTVEGIYAVEIAYNVAKEVGVYAPIISAVYNVVYRGANPMEEIKELMIGKLKKE